LDFVFWGVLGTERLPILDRYSYVAMLAGAWFQRRGEYPLGCAKKRNKKMMLLKKRPRQTAESARGAR